MTINYSKDTFIIRRYYVVLQGHTMLAFNQQIYHSQRACPIQINSFFELQ